MARIMVISGVATIGVGVVCGALLWTPLYAIAALALVDFALAGAYSSGRLKVQTPNGGGVPD